MRTLKLSLLIALISLASCGQKGPLYIEDSPPTTAAPVVNDVSTSESAAAAKTVDNSRPSPQ